MLEGIKLFDLVQDVLNSWRSSVSIFFLFFFLIFRFKYPSASTLACTLCMYECLIMCQVRVKCLVSFQQLFTFM